MKKAPLIIFTGLVGGIAVAAFAGDAQQQAGHHAGQAGEGR